MVATNNLETVAARYTLVNTAANMNAHTSKLYSA